jgi:hypothetical protein
VNASNERLGSLCDIHRCPLYGRFRGHSGHQPSELSARPPALAIGLPVTLLGGFEFFALPLFKLALPLLGLGDLLLLSSIMRRSRSLMWVPLAASLMMKGSGGIVARGTAVSNSRLEVSVMFDLARGYVASALELRLPVTALRSSCSTTWPRC